MVPLLKICVGSFVFVVEDGGKMIGDTETVCGVRFDDSAGRCSEDGNAKKC